MKRIVYLFVALLMMATGIRGLSSAPSPNGDENYYTLNGQKVSNPSKGLFISKMGKKLYYETNYSYIHEPSTRLK